MIALRLKPHLRGTTVMARSLGAALAAKKQSGRKILFTLVHTLDCGNENLEELPKKHTKAERPGCYIPEIMKSIAEINSEWQRERSHTS